MAQKSPCFDLPDHLLEGEDFGQIEYAKLLWVDVPLRAVCDGSRGHGRISFFL